MRALFVFSSVAVLALIGASAQAQTTSRPSASAPPAASARHHDDRGYNSRVQSRKVRKARRSGTIVPDFTQTSSGASRNLGPYGPPA